MRVFSAGVLHLFDMHSIKVLLLSFLASALMMAGIWGVMRFGIYSYGWGDIWGIGSIVKWMGDGIVAFLSWYLIPIFLTVIVGFFLDSVSARVDEKNYPEMGAAPNNMPIIETVLVALRFLVLMTIISLVLLIISFLVTPFVAIPLYCICNGYLFGREYFEMVAMRRLSVEQITLYRKQNHFFVWSAGTVFIALMFIPVVNLIIPVVGAATFTHFINRMIQNG